VALDCVVTNGYSYPATHLVERDKAYTIPTIKPYQQRFFGLARAGAACSTKVRITGYFF
jgi:hypothetical protein